MRIRKGRVAFLLILLAAVVALIVYGCGRLTRKLEKSSGGASASAGGSESEAQEPDSSEEASPVPEENLSDADKLARDFAALLPRGDVDAIAGLLRFRPESLAYLQDVTIDSAEVYPSGAEGIYDLTLTVSNAGPTNLLTGTNYYKMQIGMPAYGDGGVTVLCIANDQQFRTLDEIYADPACSQIHLLRWSSDIGEFESVQDLSLPKLMDFITILASVDSDPIGANRRYTFTQDEVNATSKKYFGFGNFNLTSSPQYNKATGMYEVVGRDGFTRNERIINSVDNGEGGRDVFVETFSDSLQLVMENIYQYTLMPNKDGSYRYVSCRRVALG